MMNMQRQPGQPGYVLLVTLLMLVLMAVAMAGLCRTSLESALAARRAEEQLQYRWGAASSRYTLLEQGPAILDERWRRLLAQQNERPEGMVSGDDDIAQLRQLQGEVTLGRWRFDFVLTDEQAKVNVNTLVLRQNKTQAAQAIARLIDTRDAALRIDLRPLEGRLAAQLGCDVVPDLTYVFADADLPVLLTPDRGVHEVLTCWGNGRLRWALATDEAIAAVCEPIIGPEGVQRLMRLRRTHPHTSMDHLGAALAVNPRQSSLLRNVLTDRSDCHTLWLHARSERRSWTQLIVHRPNARPADRVKTFAW